MKVTSVFVVLTLFSYFEDVATQARYKEGMCLEFQPLLRSGSLYCSRDIDPIIGPDGKTHTNKCVMCREVLRKRGFAINDGWSTSTTEKDDGCSEYMPYFKKEGIICTRENDPVRDVFGRQYSNKCMMCAQKFKNEGYTASYEKKEAEIERKERGDECYEYRSQVRPDGGLTCTRENDPIRDIFGRMHINTCLMCAEIFKKEIREGKFGGGGTIQNANGNRIVQGNVNRGDVNQKNCSPVGGSLNRNDINNPCLEDGRIAQGDYRSYTNCGGVGESSQSNANCERRPFNRKNKRKAVIDHKLNCGQLLAALKEKGNACSSVWSPVCGTDGKTYSNKCLLCLEIERTEDVLALKHEGECSKVVNGKVDCSKYSQTGGNVLCKRSTQEVCGTDGETYSNECTLCDRILKMKSEIGIKNIGPCPKGK
ncbi:serine protease inhibitor Kazal-type 5-like [Eublepharis macularius]|uniref:Serine protease inhibitor Kazal-type 5-like n=1 Tax=Eublepharis macularius TaxID=481883 RepID=A0AA97KXA4_EUBMA|nr:serine protease inhibitor Kazal-type 5-like [Eublepharis macularius]